jgi:hypothetical protein
MQVSSEKTIFMQKAIYFVSKLIAARGILELTDRYINFQVSPLDASFGMKSISIDLCSITDLRMEERGLRPKVIVVTAQRNYEFILANGQKLYETLAKLVRDPVTSTAGGGAEHSALPCACGKLVSPLYQYCPWCGKRL